MHAELFHVVALKDFAVELECFGHGLRLFGQIARVANIGRQVAERLGQCHAFGNGLALMHALFGGGQFVTTFDADRQLAQRAANFFLLALELIEPVGGIQRCNDGLADAPGDAALPDLEFGQEKCGVEGAGFVEDLDGGTDGVGEFLFAEFLFLAQANQQDAVAKRGGHVVQQQCAACLAFHVATAHDVGNVAAGRVVEQFCREGQFPRFKNTDDHAGAALFFRASAFYAKFHKLLLIKEISVFEGLSSHFFGFVKA
ncbi:hypothetical protein SDC9_111448 [bioreactor metagenome]|uniref:Uncharacterized protein n=1 Tax=bioreactor metagenome TaxID=1076179 RepID=A0A645BJ22_9ZZZZ